MPDSSGFVPHLVKDVYLFLCQRNAIRQGDVRDEHVTGQDNKAPDGERHDNDRHLLDRQCSPP